MKKTHSVIYGIFTKELPTSLIPEWFEVSEEEGLKRLSDSYQDFKLWDPVEDDIAELIDILDNAFYDLTSRHE